MTESEKLFLPNFACKDFFDFRNAIAFAFHIAPFVPHIESLPSVSQSH
jgi:hypothetical protein